MQAKFTHHLCRACGYLVEATLNRAWPPLVALSWSCYRPRLAATFARFGATWWDLQCKLILVATCAGLGVI